MQHGAIESALGQGGPGAAFHQPRACPDCARRLRDRCAYMRKLAANYESLPAVDSLALARSIRGLRPQRARLGGLVSRLFA